MSDQLQGLLSALPLDELSDAIGRVDSDGRIVACNRAMHDLLALVTVDRFDELPESFVVTRGFRRVERDGVAWVFAGGDDDVHGARLRSARLRELGELSSWIVHDLGNLLLSGVALADTLTPLVEDAEDREILVDLQRGARQSTTIGRVLANLLSKSPRGWRVRAASDLVEDALAILRKHAAKQSIDLEVAVSTEAAVRVPEHEIVQALMAGTICCLQAGGSRLAVNVRDASEPAPGDHRRRMVEVRLATSPIVPGAAANAIALLGPGARPLKVLAASEAPGDELLNARFIMARCGGALRAVATGEALALDYQLPIVARAEPARQAVD